MGVRVYGECDRCRRYGRLARRGERVFFCPRCADIPRRRDRGALDGAVVAVWAFLAALLLFAVLNALLG